MTITILDLVLKGNMRKSMKQKKVTVIISYDYDNGCTASNERVAERIRRDLVKGSDPRHEKIESVTVEDVL